MVPTVLVGDFCAPTRRIAINGWRSSLFTPSARLPSLRDIDPCLNCPELISPEGANSRALSS